MENLLLCPNLPIHRYYIKVNIICFILQLARSAWMWMSWLCVLTVSMSSSCFCRSASWEGFCVSFSLRQSINVSTVDHAERNYNSTGLTNGRRLSRERKPAGHSCGMAQVTIFIYYWFLQRAEHELTLHCLRFKAHEKDSIIVCSDRSL